MFIGWNFRQVPWRKIQVCSFFSQAPPKAKKLSKNQAKALEATNQTVASIFRLPIRARVHIMQTWQHLNLFDRCARVLLLTCCGYLACSTQTCAAYSTPNASLKRAN
jgi:hypothetical protein